MLLLEGLFCWGCWLLKGFLLFSKNPLFNIPNNKNANSTKLESASLFGFYKRSQFKNDQIGIWIPDPGLENIPDPIVKIYYRI